MLTHPIRPACVLIRERDLDDEADHPALVGIVDKLRGMFSWAREYLSRPHAELGRKGPVCPFVQGAMERERFYLAVYRGTALQGDDLNDELMIYRDWFRVLPPTDGPAAQFKTILLTLPDVSGPAANALVDAIQQRLKPRYVADGLMIGEFHDGPPDKGGLWNPDFRPLRSPLPLLAIRHMVPSDFPFLAGDPAFLTAYLRMFGDVVPAALRPRVAAAANAFGLSLPAQPAAPASSMSQPSNQGA
ncbi:MAG TPA: hypothetical protein VFX60_14580 [Micromonospora sp.]|nr:hypothetical protein [Micromonospora sp.]